MDDKKIVEAVAKIENPSILRVVHKVAIGVGQSKYRSQSGETGWSDVPAYLTSHDAVQPVVDGLDVEEMLKVVVEFGANWSIYLKATPRQKCEAILKAVGKWEAGE